MPSTGSLQPAVKPALSRTPYVAVLGLSARMLAQSAARAGFNVIALDMFGDRDTQQHACLWFDIGDGSGALRIDRDRLLDALARVARIPHLLGFIAGSGIEPLAGALQCAPHMPHFLGNSAEACAAVRDPQRFFPLLDTLDIAHPAVTFTRPADGQAGWLVKHANGCGGMHVKPLDASAQNEAAAGTYFQRLVTGHPMSALFIAARREAVVVGYAKQLVMNAGALPFVHAGSTGPVDLPRNVAGKVDAAIRAIVARVGLTGINSIDFMLDGESVQVLEINARPSSTMALYERAWPALWPRGLIACHIDACLHGKFPEFVRGHAMPPDRTGPHAGQRVLFAPHGFTVTQAFSDACLDDPVCRDVPQPGTRIEAGQPVCTLEVTARSADDVPHALERERTRLLQRIATCHESAHDVIPG
ncbi:hypothetical protein R70241_04725 [Paraburkholderia saeva]|nr:ATP-grasp domain-containing protein [Paraburkholderia saeva]CAG4919239.1 hypothetical protein R70241_04725 [Paraburkholderia saeva]